MPTMNAIHTVTVLGAGSWGTALALHLARKGLTVCLWGKSPHIEALQQQRVNAYHLPGIAFPDSLHCTADVQEALAFSQQVVVAVPSHVFRLVLQHLQPYWTDQHQLIWATKGLDPSTNQLLHQVVLDVMGPVSAMAVLSGPNFAREIALGLPAATTIACEQEKVLEQFCALFKSETLRVYGSHDVLGVQIGGAVKNVIAIAVGLCDGLNFGANARAALITRGLAEITRLGVAMGACSETFVGMAGMGDLLLTCTDNQSRNRRFGLLKAQGKATEQVFEEIGQIVEGYHNVQQVLSLAHHHQLPMPITEQVYSICYQNLDPHLGALALLRR